MIRFILVTFLFLGWAFYELSGGSTFEPEEQTVAVTEETTMDADGIEIVTRGVDSTLASLAVPERLTQPLIEQPAVADAPDTTAAIDPTLSDDVSDDVAAVLEDVSAELAPEPSGIDLREVAGSRVNMRTGPGTDYGVVTTLDGGTRAEVIETDPSGWVRLRVENSGLEGWMAARLLTSVDG